MPEAIARLFNGANIDKRVYTDPWLFEQEQERIFAKAWHYVGHVSQLGEAGRYVNVEVQGQPILVMRGGDGTIRAFFNRCPHRGALLTRHPCGQAEQLVCSYHAWSFDTCGQLRGLPMSVGYEGTPVQVGDARWGLAGVPRLDEYAGFLFVNLDAQAPALLDWLGPNAGNLMNMLERSPSGLIEPFGGVFRMTQRNNWKVYLENLHDGAHALPTHQSSILSARQTSASTQDPWSQLQADIVSANGQPPRKMAALSVNCFERGHSEMFGFRESRPDTPEQREYEAALRDFHGAEKAQDILRTDRHIALFYPNLSITPNWMQLRVIVPLSVERTRVDIYSFRLIGASDAINRRTIAFANAVNSPTSLIRADDLENFERIEAGLKAQAPQYVSAHREYSKETQPLGASHAMSERYVRNQFHAWRTYMEHVQ